MVRQPVWEKENAEFKPVKLCSKIDFVLYSARMEGLVNTYTHTHTRIYIYIYICVCVCVCVYNIQ